jgi:hypothetical protein
VAAIAASSSGVAAINDARAHADKGLLGAEHAREMHVKQRAAAARRE